VCKNTGIETRDDYSEEEIFNLNFNTKHQIRKTHILGKLTAFTSVFSGGLISVLVRFVADIE